MEVLARITAPHFCAGVVFRNARASEAAPIVKWMIGKTAKEVKAYCDRKGWSIERCR